MKPFLRASWLSVLSIVAIPAPASAQDTSKVGLVMSTPSTVSVIWHASETVALRPEIAFVRSTSTHEAPGGDAESTQTTVIPGFSVLFYTGRFDALRTYVSPRYTYSRARVESSSPLGSSESTGTSHSISGSIGAEYTLHRRFAVFGELGVNYTHADAPNTSSNAWNQRTAVGAILYF